MAIFYQPPEPRQAYPKVLPQTQGAQPKPTGPLGGSVNALTAVGVWATLAAVPMPVQKPLNVVPLTLKYGSQPVPVAPLSATQANVAIRWWDLPVQVPPSLIGVGAIKGVAAAPAFVPFNPANPAIGLWPQADWKAQSGPKIVPLTLPRGDSVPFAPQQLGTIVISWPSQSAPQSAAWNVPAVVQSVVLNGPPRQSMWDAVRQEPPRPVAIATLTLARGDVVPFSRPPIFWTPLDWPSQSEESNAGWNFVPPVISQPSPYVRFQSHVLAEAIYWPSQSEADNAAWNVPVIVSQPTPYVRLRHHLLVAGPSWGAQSYPPNAAWNFISLAIARAIAQSDGTDAIVSSTSASGTLVQNSGIIAINTGDSQAIQIITGNSGVISLDSDG